MPPHDVEEAEPIGDTAVAVRIAAAAPAAMLERVRAAAVALEAAGIPGVTDVVASPGRVTVVYDPATIAGCEPLARAVAAVVGTAATVTSAGTRHEIPVVYDGPDLDEVCTARRLDRRDFCTAHCDPDYVVESIGFLPGFGYLAGLPPALAMPRRTTPRTRVPAGSVGIGGGQTGVYPSASPGGWNLVGRTDVVLFDPAASRPSALAVGDHVRFTAADPPPPRRAPDAPRHPTTPAEPAITVERPGLFTTVQDLGRPGHRSSGVPLSGAVDPVALRLANLLVGNPASAAALECTLVGPTLRFDRAAIVAQAGAVFGGLPMGRAVHVAAGSVLDLGHATAGCRGYLAVAGGIDVAPVLGSRSTLVVAGLGGCGGRPLVAGDRLAIGRPDGHASPAFDATRTTGLDDPMLLTVSAGTARCTVRVIAAQADADWGVPVWSHAFRVSSRSDRMGVRLEGAAVAAPPADRASVAVVPGTIQLPPDGLPIILLADAQTIGGYPVIGQVIAADLPRVAQLRPGAEIGFHVVDVAAAHAALRHQSAALANRGMLR